MQKIKRYLIMLLIVFLPVQSFANAYSSYAIQAAAWQAGDVAVNAVKNGIKKGIKVKPSPSLVAKRLPQAAIVLGLTSMLGSGVDYVMDPANNTVTYTDTMTNALYQARWDSNQTDWHTTQGEACLSTLSLLKANTNGMDWQYSHFTSDKCHYIRWGNSAFTVDLLSKTEPIQKSLTYDEVAQELVSIAPDNVQAQEYLVDAVVADVGTGAYDTEFDNATGYNVGIDGINGSDGVDGTDANIDTSGIISAISGLSSKITSMQGVLVGAISDVRSGVADLIGQQTQDIINSQTTQTDAITDAIDAQTVATGEVIGQQTQDIINSQTTQTDAITDAIDAQTVATGEVIGQQTQDIIDSIDASSSDVVNSLDDVVSDLGNITDAIGSQTDSVTDSIDSQTDSVTDSIDSQTDSVTDSINSVNEKIDEKVDEMTEELPEENTEVDIPEIPTPTVNTAVRFGGSCPADSVFRFELFGVSHEWMLMDWTYFCGFLKDYVRYVLYLLGSIFSVIIIGRS